MSKNEKTIQQQAGGGFGTIAEPENPKGKEKPEPEEPKEDGA